MQGLNRHTARLLLFGRESLTHVNKEKAEKQTNSIPSSNIKVTKMLDNHMCFSLDLANSLDVHLLRSKQGRVAGKDENKTHWRVRF
jgi:hypothetical protein